jgi:hypothetical protein
LLLENVAPYYFSLASFARSKAYSAFEEIALQNPVLERFFFKGESEYNLQVLATLTSEASIDLERQVVRTQMELQEALREEQQQTRADGKWQQGFQQ